MYIISGLSWSMNISGKIIDLNFKLSSIKFFSDKKWDRCDPNPPIEPSSIDIIASWSVAICQNKFSSNTGVEVKVIELPKISQWIQFVPTLASDVGIVVGFSRKDIHLGNTIQFLDNSRPTPQGGDADTAQSMFYPVPLKLRCTNLYFTTTGIAGKLLVGLTSIDRSEFTEVVETFLGD